MRRKGERAKRNKGDRRGRGQTTERRWRGSLKGEEASGGGGGGMK